MNVSGGYRKNMKNQSDKLLNNSLSLDVGPIILRADVDLSLDELLLRLGDAGKKPAFYDTAVKVLDNARKIWQPKLVYRWLDVGKIDKTRLILACAKTGDRATLDLGFSIQFVKKALKVVVGVYTVGEELEEHAKRVSGNGLVLEAYVYDLVALGILEKIGQKMNLIVEKYGSEHGWGVSPFLSPGSVHGWELDDQHNLIELLPTGDIGISKSEGGVLLPFKSLSLLIGTGPGYKETQVGSTCRICSRKDKCEMHM